MLIKKFNEVIINSNNLEDATCNSKKTIFEIDENGREISCYRFNNLIATNKSIFYPSIKLFSENDSIVYSPVDEEIMSLKTLNIDSNENFASTPSYSSKYSDPLFFFVYNTDNYYHFVYDTLPYLITFFQLRKSFPNLKLLVSSPNFQREKPYPFFYEFLELLGINKKDLIFITESTMYSSIFISDSYTHSGKSNLPPRKEIYQFFSDIVKKASLLKSNVKLNEKIYISRRAWKHGDTSNIGTNYTQKRTLNNESELVRFLESKGFSETFTENLSVIDKINLFSSAKVIIGPSGGGLCNVLFSNKNAQLLSINSPDFMSVNKRFIYSFANIKTIFYDETFHVEDTKFKKYMRVQSHSNNIVGEVEEFKNDKVKISYTENILAGWNAELNLKSKWINASECVILDNGLNSPWSLNLDEFIIFYSQIKFS
jgi:hypothetical protein